MINDHVTVYMQPMEGLVARGRRTDGPSRLVPVDGLWECRCRVGVVKPHASADRTADTTRGDTVPWESQTLAERGIKCEIKPYALERFTFQIHSYQLQRLGIPDTCCVRERSSSRAESSGVCRHGARARATAHAHTTAKIGRCQDPSAGGTIAVLPRLPCPSSISYIVAPPSLRVA